MFGTNMIAAIKQIPTFTVDAVFLSLEEPAEKCDLCALVASMMDKFLAAA